MTRFALATIFLAGTVLTVSPTATAGQHRIATKTNDESSSADRYLRPAEAITAAHAATSPRAGTRIQGAPGGAANLGQVRQVETSVVDTLRQQPQGFVVPQTWDTTSVFVGAWQERGWAEAVAGPEFSSDRDGVLTEVGGFLAWLPADGCATPEPFIVEVRKATTFGCGCCRTECPDMSATGLLGSYPMTPPVETSQVYTYQYARPQLTIEGGELYFALFRAPAHGCAGGVLAEASDPFHLSADPYKAGSAIFGAVTEGEAPGAGGASMAARVRVRKFAPLE